MMICDKASCARESVIRQVDGENIQAMSQICCLSSSRKGSSRLHENVSAVSFVHSLESRTCGNVSKFNHCR